MANEEIRNAVMKAAKEYGYNFIKDSVDVDEVIRTFNDEGRVLCPELYNSADDVDIVLNKIVDKAKKELKEKMGEDIDPYDYFFKIDECIDSGMLKAYCEILHCRIKFEDGYVRKMTEEEWHEFLKEIDAW